MKQLKLQLPKDIADAPVAVREQILSTLREAMQLPQEQVFTRSGGSEHNMWARNDVDIIAQLEDEFYEYLQDDSAHRMADVFWVLGLTLDGVDMDKSFS